MMSVISLCVFVLGVIMLSGITVSARFIKLGDHAKCYTLSVIVLSVGMLSVIMPIVIVPNVMAP
jgi:hypothetical protein